MYRNIKKYQKNILITATIIVTVLFCFILIKSYRISSISNNLDKLPIIKSKVDTVKIKSPIEKPYIAENSFYKNFKKVKEDTINIDKSSISNINIDDHLNNKLNSVIYENVTNNNKNLNNTSANIELNKTTKVVITNKKENNDNINTNNIDKNNNFYKVQLIALKNKQQADNFVKKIKKQFNNLLKNLEVFLFEVDLGDKGIFYRVQVGNFNTKNDAMKFCRNYLMITLKNPTNCIVVR